MRRTVLVTRAEPGATATASRVAALGHQPIVLPLSRTVPVEVDPDATGFKGAATVAVTSAAALRHAPETLLSRLVHLRCLAVGAATAAAARSAGFRHVETGPGDAEGLAPMLLDAGSAGTTIFLCGRVRSDVLETHFARAGMPLITVETYDIANISYPTDSALDRLGTNPVDIVLLHAAAGRHELNRLAETPDLRQYFEKTRFLCLSPRIAAGIRRRGGQAIAVAASPDEQSLLSMLKACD